MSEGIVVVLLLAAIIGIVGRKRSRVPRGKGFPETRKRRHYRDIFFTPS